MISLLIILVVAALLLWVLGQFPLDPVLLRVIRAIVIVVVCLYALGFILSLFGVPWPSFPARNLR